MNKENNPIGEKRSIGAVGAPEKRREAMLKLVETVLAYADLMDRPTTVTIEWPKGGMEFMPPLPDQTRREAFSRPADDATAQKTQKTQ